jgi:hypothetical protein
MRSRQARPVRRGAGLSCLCLLLAACSGGVRHDDGNAAVAICQAAFPGQPVAGSFLTTIGTVRGRAVGPGLRPAANAWPGHPDSEIAAWCYVDLGNGSRASAVVPAEPPVDFVTGNVTTGPEGPQIP